MNQITSPRVNGALLSQYQGKTVRLVGRVVNYQPGSPTANIEASDGVTVTIRLNPVSQISSSFIEVLGTVNPDNSLSEIQSTSFGDNFGTFL